MLALPRFNQLRGLLAEFGLTIPLGIKQLVRQLPAMLEDAENGLPGISRELFSRLFRHFRELDRQVEEIETQIQSWHRSNASQRLQETPGIGPITATALVASVGNARAFENGWQLAAWLGLVPRQHSSGGKDQLLGISKRGDTYLRTFLIHGARAVLKCVKGKTDARSSWLERLAERRNPYVAAVALANKNARIVWALLSRDHDFQVGYANPRGIVTA